MCTERVVFAHKELQFAQEQLLCFMSCRPLGLLSLVHFVLAYCTFYFIKKPPLLFICCCSLLPTLLLVAANLCCVLVQHKMHLLENKIIVVVPLDPHDTYFSACVGAAPDCNRMTKYGCMLVDSFSC